MLPFGNITADRKQSARAPNNKVRFARRVAFRTTASGIARHSSAQQWLLTLGTLTVSRLTSQSTGTPYVTDLSCDEPTAADRRGVGA